jgi:hypothetical protein
MKSICKDLTSATLNWNVAIGSVSAISLCAKTPAINLHVFTRSGLRAGAVGSESQAADNGTGAERVPVADSPEEILHG